MYHPASYIWALSLGAAIGIPLLAALMVQRASKENGAGRATGLSVAAVAVAWLLASGLLAHFGVYLRGGREAAPWFGIALAGALGAALVATRLPSVHRALAGPSSLARLTWPHTLRVGGVVFLILLAQGHLPAVFALPAGIGDVAVGMSAPFLARRLARSDLSGAYRFNVLGIADLVVALGIGFLAGLGPIRIFHGAASTVALGQLPLALIPTVAVPTAIALHVASLVQLRRSPAARRRPLRFGRQPKAAATSLTALNR